ncbi:MAG: glycosyltransferase family 4 protein [Allosphingosinicella sp.]
MKGAKRLLLATDAVGGVWQYSLDLARALAPLGYRAVLALVGPAPSPAQRGAARGLRLIETGLPLDWLAADRAALRRAGKALAALARREGANLVQVGSAALLADAPFDMPTIAVQHSCLASWWKAVRGTPLPADFQWRTELVRTGLEAADAVIAPTRAFASVTRRLYGLTAQPRVVYNGRGAFPVAEAARHDCVFTAGRLWDEGKNLATLDAAAARLPVPVHAAGPLAGPNGARIAFDAIHPLGELGDSEIRRRLAARPVFASSALYEPFGLAVLEAASAGCPLVLSDIPTFRELWDGAALFVPPRDSAGFAAAIGDLVGDDCRCDALGRAARERAARYVPRATAEAMAAIYGGLVTPARPVSASANMAAAL